MKASLVLAPVLLGSGLVGSGVLGSGMLAQDGLEGLLRSLPVAPIVAGLVAFIAIWRLGKRSLPARDDLWQGASEPEPVDDRKGLAARLPRAWRESMSAAGLTAGDVQLAFVASHGLAIAVGCVVGAVAAQRVESPIVATVAFAACSVVGWWLPVSWLEGRRLRRRLEMSADFPMMLDLLRIGLGGGLGLPAAWATVAGSMKATSSALSEEMRRIEIEVGFGLEWSTALDRASARTGVHAFRSLGSLVAQSSRFGTELSKVLEVLSDSLRLEAMQSLEERAQVASVRLLVPLGALLLPATVLVLAGPLLLLLIETLQNVNAD